MISILKQLREEKSYTQKYVGSILGIGQNTYSKLENGQIRLTTERICKLAELYEVEPEIFFNEQFPVINFNNGTSSKGIVKAEKYIDQCSKDNIGTILVLKDKIIEEKDKQILMLKEQLAEKNREICFWRDFTSEKKNVQN